MRKARSLTLAILAMALVTFGLTAALIPTQAIATTSCTKPYLAAGKKGLQTTPVQGVGQVGKLPPLPGHPSWDGRDLLETGTYLPSANEMFVGGVASNYNQGGQSAGVHNLYAVRAGTWTIVPGFRPRVNGEVTGMALSCNGKGLYIVGNFTKVNGLARHYAAEVSVATGRVWQWNPNPDGAANDVSVVAGHVVVGGAFHHIGGKAHAYISAVDPKTGQATNWVHLHLAGPVQTGSVMVGRIVGSPDQTKMAVEGNFLNANGTYHSRIVQLAVTSRAATLLPWATNYTRPGGYTGCNPNFGWKERDAMYSPDSRKLYTWSTGGYAKPNPNRTTYHSICDSITEWRAGAQALRNGRAVPLAQNFTGGDSLTGGFVTFFFAVGKGHARWADNPPTPGEPCTAPDGSVHYAGFDCPGPTAVNRQGISAFRASDLSATSWNPTMSRQRGMHVRFVATPTALCVLSDADQAAGQPHNDIACWRWSS